MKRKKIPSWVPSWFPISYANLVWGILALAVWGTEQYLHARQGVPFSPTTFAKGFLLLMEAIVLYQFSAFQGYPFLGMFPLLWMAVSRFQWDICSIPEYRFWLWLALFMAAEIIILALPDGKKLLAILVFFWAVLIHFFKVSFLLPLTFLTAPSARLKNAAWVRWGGLAAAVLFYLFFQGRFYFQFDWTDSYELLVEKRYLAFLALGWLGFFAYDSKWKGTFRHVLFPPFLLTLGFLFWGGNNLTTALEFEVLLWVFLFVAGYGLEAFRKYIIDDSWHGKLVWFVIGVALFGGIL